MVLFSSIILKPNLTALLVHSRTWSNHLVSQVLKHCYKILEKAVFDVGFFFCKRGLRGIRFCIVFLWMIVYLITKRIIGILVYKEKYVHGNEWWPLLSPCYHNVIRCLHRAIWIMIYRDFLFLSMFPCSFAWKYEVTIYR